MKKPKILGMILAGGQGRRLYPLTEKRTKPAVPFGSKYRIIDFAISNMINSEIYGVYILTQFKAQSLTEHIQHNWRFGNFLKDYFITLAPAQMYLYEKLGQQWYRGTADAIYQNLHLVSNRKPSLVAIFSGDHIYKMDIRHMVEKHLDTNAAITIATYPTSIDNCKRFGVLQVNEGYQITDFQEKPKNPKPLPNNPNLGLVSMGNYIFNIDALIKLLEADAKTEGSEHDFGKNVLPMALEKNYKLQAYDFTSNPIPGQIVPNTYWRDVGTIDSYWEANMDLVAVEPEFDIFNQEWPLFTSSEFSPPTKFVHEEGYRRGQAFNSMISGGVIISGATVRNSVIARRVRINSYSLVENSVIFDDCSIGRHSVIRNAIIDKGVKVPQDMHIGVDLDKDSKQGFTVTERGIVVVPKNYAF